MGINKFNDRENETQIIERIVPKLLILIAVWYIGGNKSHINGKKTAFNGRKSNKRINSK
jgi:hypothetical protein